MEIKVPVISKIWTIEGNYIRALFVTHIAFQGRHLEAFLQITWCQWIHTALTYQQSLQLLTHISSQLPLLLHCSIAIVSCVKLVVTNMMHVAFLHFQRLVEKIHCKGEHIIYL